MHTYNFFACVDFSLDAGGNENFGRFGKKKRSY